MDNDLLCESKDFEVVVQKRKNARKSTPGIVLTYHLIQKLNILINVRNNSKPDNLAVPFPITTVLQLALFAVSQISMD